MNAEERERKFLEEVRRELNSGADSLDAETLLRLRMARERALEERERRWWSPFIIPRWVTASGLATAAVLVVAVSLWVGSARERLPLRQAEDVEIITAQEQLELYEDLEFYRWLAAANGR